MRFRPSDTEVQAETPISSGTKLNQTAPFNFFPLHFPCKPGTSFEVGLGLSACALSSALLTSRTCR